MPSAELPTETFAASAVVRTAVTLAVRHFDLPAAMVMHREFNGWRCLVSGGKQADQLLGELNRHTALFDLGESLVVVPDLDNDTRLHLDTFPEPAAPGRPHLRFLAGSVHGPDAPASAVCFCLLDTRPRQFDAEDKTLLVELAETVAADFWTRAARRT